MRMTRPFMITLLVTTASVLCAARIVCAETANIIYVPTDYATIAGAADAAAAGDTIFIASGRYDEVVIIRKPMHLMGEISSEVIVGGMVEFSGIYFATDDVNIENITSISLMDIAWQNHITIRNCILKHQIGFLGSQCILDGCVILIPENPPRDDPYFTNVASSGILMDVGTGNVMSNNLLLGVKATSVGHFEGQLPTYITPTPTIPCTDWFCPGGSQVGFAAAIFGVLVGTDTRIVNNTIVNVFGGDTGYLTYEQLEYWAFMFPGEANGIRAAYPNNMHIANNIIWNVRGGVPRFPTYDGRWMAHGPASGLYVGGHQKGYRLIIENNMFYDMDYGVLVEINDGTDGIVLRNNYWASPGFVNSASVDYHLLPNSPAIDAGTPIAWLTQDAEGNPRPSNFGWDIGAFEYQNLLSDLNQDGKVDSLDLNEFVKQWGMELPKAEKPVKPAQARIVYITPAPSPDPFFTPIPSAHESTAIRQD